MRNLKIFLSPEEWSFRPEIFSRGGISRDNTREVDQRACPKFAVPKISPVTSVWVPGWAPLRLLCFCPSDWGFGPRISHALPVLLWWQAAAVGRRATGWQEWVEEASRWPLTLLVRLKNSLGALPRSLPKDFISHPFTSPQGAGQEFWEICMEIKVTFIWTAALTTWHLFQNLLKALEADCNKLELFSSTFKAFWKLALLTFLEPVLLLMSPSTV